jgi:hypothetical protein
MKVKFDKILGELREEDSVDMNFQEATTSTLTDRILIGGAAGKFYTDKLYGRDFLTRCTYRKIGFSDFIKQFNATLKNAVCLDITRTFIECASGNIENFRLLFRTETFQTESPYFIIEISDLLIFDFGQFSLTEEPIVPHWFYVNNKLYFKLLSGNTIVDFYLEIQLPG